MPLRTTPFANGHFYHLVSRSLYRRPIFKPSAICQLFLENITYYLLKSPPVKFSYYRRKKSDHQSSLNFADRLATIIAYCVMPNHFHLLVRQDQEKGIQKLMHAALNSFAHYYNTKQHQKGPVFESRFVSVLVETDEQLLHLSRYIHLNPVTAHLVEMPQDYPFSSYSLYQSQPAFAPFETQLILDHFPSTRDYHQFVMDQKDYQRELAQIKHLLLERAF